MRTVEGNTSALRDRSAADGLVSADEAAKFLKARQQGAALQRAATLAPAGGLLAGAGSPRQRLLEALANVPIFEHLQPQQLVQLRDAMQPAPFTEGSYVLEQGEVGDVFYVILEGTAEVVRYAGAFGDEEEIVRLARIKEFGHFGERALLLDEARASAVRASAKLSTVYITRARFEQTIGRPLSDFVEDF